MSDCFNLPRLDVVAINLNNIVASNGESLMRSARWMIGQLHRHSGTKVLIPTGTSSAPHLGCLWGSKMAIEGHHIYGRTYDTVTHLGIYVMEQKIGDVSYSRSRILIGYRLMCFDDIYKSFTGNCDARVYLSKGQ